MRDGNEVIGRDVQEADVFHEGPAGILADLTLVNHGPHKYVTTFARTC